MTSFKLNTIHVGTFFDVPTFFIIYFRKIVSLQKNKYYGTK